MFSVVVELCLIETASRKCTMRIGLISVVVGSSIATFGGNHHGLDVIVE